MMIALDNESQVRLVGEEQDYLLLDEIITEPAPERLLPFKKLIEDEILLKAPMAPKHDDCEMVNGLGDISEEGKMNAFAALASLRQLCDGSITSINRTFYLLSAFCPVTGLCRWRNMRIMSRLLRILTTCRWQRSWLRKRTINFRRSQHFNTSWQSI